MKKMNPPKEIDGLYYEVTFNGKHCYKYQPIDKEIIIVSDTDKQTAYNTIIEKIQLAEKQINNG